MIHLFSTPPHPFLKICLLVYFENTFLMAHFKVQLQFIYQTKDYSSYGEDIQHTIVNKLDGVALLVADPHPWIHHSL